MRTLKKNHIDQFMSLGITVTRGARDDEVILRRSHDHLSISVGDHMKTVIKGQPFDVIVREVVFSNTGSFQKLVVDVEGLVDGFKWKKQSVWNVPLFHSFLNYNFHELENNCDFWIHLQSSSHGGPARSSAAAANTTTPHKRASPLSPLNEFKFSKTAQGLRVTNMHGIPFDIVPGTWFASEVTFEDNHVFKAANLNRTRSTNNTLSVGRIEGRFEHFHSNEAEVSLAVYLGGSHMKRTVNYGSDLEFWHNLEIITHSKRFPEDGEIECTSSDKISVYDMRDKIHVFQKGDTFDTTIFRPASWHGFLKERINFDFAEQSGKDVKIYGNFHSFDPKQKTAVISIDFNTSEKALIAVAGIAATAAVAYAAPVVYEGVRSVAQNVASAAHGAAQGVYHGVASAAHSVRSVAHGVASKLATKPSTALTVYNGRLTSGGGRQEGGALGKYYTVPLNPDLPFWKNLNVTKATCKLADAKSRSQIKSVRHASEKVNVVVDTTTTRKKSPSPTQTTTSSPQPRRAATTTRKISNYQKMLNQLF